jgi:hypothetical protein
LGILLHAVISSNSEVVQSETVIGELVNFNPIQGNDGSMYSIFIVKLENENTVRVQPPSHTPIKINKKIELEKRIYENGESKYYFKKYSNGGS